MITLEPAPPPEPLDLFLLAYDEALAAGLPGGHPSQPGADLDPGLVPRLESACHCLQLLERLWGRSLRAKSGARHGSEATAAGQPVPAPQQDALSPAPPPPQPPVQIGRFQVLRELGRGGGGIVLLAFDPALGRQVALKVPRPEAVLTPELRRRFLREARAAACLNHPHVVAIYEVGEEGPVCYIAEEYCEGPTLSAWLAGQGSPLAHRTAAGLTAVLADALEHAHRHGVLHRDLKPSNVVLSPGAGAEGTRTRDGDLDYVPKLTDFGLAKLLTQDRDETASGTVLGTPAYMAPEQAAGHRGGLSTLTDVYALGVVLYELLTGRPPFRGETALDTLQQARQNEPVPPSRLRPKLPRDLETICLRCLEKEPHKRYASAGALAEDLRRFLAGVPIRARPVRTGERLGRWCRRNPALAAAGGLAVAALAAVATLSLAFALHYAGANRLLSDAGASLRQEQQQTRAALDKAEKQYAPAERRSAVMAFDRGLALCERGEVGGGMLWLAHSLDVAARLAPGDAADIAWGARANLAVWGRELKPLRGILWHPPGVRTAAFSPDGRTLVTGGYDPAARLWEVATGKPIGSPLQPPAPVCAVAMLADNRTVITISTDGTAQRWDAATAQPVGAPWRHGDAVQAVAVSTDGRWVVTAGGDGSARLWNTAPGAPVGPVLRHEGSVESVAFSPDGRTVLTGCADKKAWFWDAASGKRRAVFLPHEAAVKLVAYSPDGRTVLTGCADKTVRFWDAATGKPDGFPLQHDDWVLGMAISPDGKTVLTGSFSRQAQLWSAENRTRLGQPLPHQNGVSAVAFSPDGRTFLTGGWDEPVRLWERLPDSRPALVLEHPDQVRAVAYSPDGRTLLTASKDRHARLWDAATGKLVAPLLEHRGRVLAAAFSPDGRTVLTGSHDRTAQQWDAATGKRVGPPLVHEDQVNAVAFSPYGRTVVTGCEDCRVRFWQAATGRPLGLEFAHERPVQAAAFSPDGRLLLTTDAFNTARFSDAATGRLEGAAVQHRGRVMGAAYSPDGRLVVTAANTTAQLWEVATRQPFGPPLRHDTTVKAVAFSPDGRCVLTGSYDKTARLWQTATAKPIGPRLVHEGEVAGVAWSPDGRTVLTGSWDNKAACGGWPLRWRASRSAWSYGSRYSPAWS
jgi:WD40 repeat protein